MKLIYVFEGDPVALKRPRFNKKAVWNSQKASMVAHGFELQNQHGSNPPFLGPLAVHFEFYFPIPKKVPKSQIDNYINKPYPYKPDLSNTIKYIEDVAHLYATLFKDDCQIVHITSFKCYDTNPRTIMVIQNYDDLKKEKNS